MSAPAIGIIGIGGYGARHLDSVRVCEGRGLCVLKAVVIREQEMEAQREQEQARRRAGVTIYRSYPQMLEQEKGRLHLVTVPAGIDQHAPQSIAALRAGFSVLCEKPAAGTMDEVRQMKKARDDARRMLAIGFQYISAPSIQRIKKLTLENRLGRLVGAKGYAAWPRTNLYYQRNYWSGKIRVNGKYIYDSPIQNAVSHFFNNMLYVAGDSPDECAIPRTVYGENLRAGAIESADTQFIRVTTTAGVPLAFSATHAVGTQVNTVLEFTCESGRILWEQDGRTSVYTHKGGRQTLSEEFGDEGVVSGDEMFRNVIDALGSRASPRSTIDNAWQHAACVEALFKSSPITQIPAEYVNVIEGAEERYRAVRGSSDAKARLTVIVGVEEVLESMYREAKSFSEIGAPWAVRGAPVPAASAP